MNVYDVKSWEDLCNLRTEAGLETDSSAHTWSLVDDVKDHGLSVSPGPDEEYQRMACRLAVRNADPEYHGYTPFGAIA